MVHNTKHYLYNILSDELIEIIIDKNKIEELIKYLIYEKYIKNNIISDDKFIDQCNNIFKKYLQNDN